MGPIGRERCAIDFHWSASPGQIGSYAFISHPRHHHRRRQRKIIISPDRPEAQQQVDQQLVVFQLVRIAVSVCDLLRRLERIPGRLISARKVNKQQHK